ncbi:MAG: hypothetical protein NTW73_00095 [Candidatus Parcubacteria bacterium]|nr:hypothetical protein [Candidatus Parcubacteria bacterium]
MIATAHLFIGAAIGSCVENPFLALGLGITSHLVTDALPHWDLGSFDKKERKEKLKNYLIIFSDVILGSILILFLANLAEKAIALNIILGAMGAILIDVIDNSPFWSYKLRQLPFFKQIHACHSWAHHKNKWQLPFKYRFVGLITQIVTILISLI